MTGGTQLSLSFKSMAETCGLAALIARLTKPGDVIALKGGLGAGKTTFARAFLHALGETGEVPSPTFTLLQTYEPPGAPAPVFHFDCYRLNRDEDAFELGIEDAFQDGISLIEWADRIASLLPEGALDILFETVADGPDDARTVTLTPKGAWPDRLREGGLDV